MIKELKHINGIEIPSLPLDLKKVGDLVYFEGSLMSVYSDNNNKPYIYDWVESDTFSNRWLIYEIDINILKDYIFQRISHFSVLQSALKDLYYIVDINSSGNLVKCKLATLKNIPNSYIPKSDIYFDEDESLGLSKIINKFNIDNLEATAVGEDFTFDILEEARQNKSELINLHIKSNNSKVSYGKIRTSTLGEVLLNFQRLNIATAVSIFDGKDKIPKEKRSRRKKGEKDFAKELGETEYIYSKAASFSIFLKPIRQTVDIYEQLSSELIADCMFNLFQASEDVEALKKFKENVDTGVLTAYNYFLKVIKDEDISITVQFASPQTSKIFKDNFNKNKALKVLENLEVAEIDATDEVKVEGKFKALDSTKYSFKFLSDKGDEYEGRFSPMLQPGMTAFNLKENYSVTLEIEEIQISGKIEYKERVLMVSCVEKKANSF